MNSNSNEIKRIISEIMILKESQKNVLFGFEKEHLPVLFSLKRKIDIKQIKDKELIKVPEIIDEIEGLVENISQYIRLSEQAILSLISDNENYREKLAFMDINLNKDYYDNRKNTFPYSQTSVSMCLVDVFSIFSDEIQDCYEKDKDNDIDNYRNITPNCNNYSNYNKYKGSNKLENDYLDTFDSRPRINSNKKNNAINSNNFNKEIEDEEDLNTNIDQLKSYYEQLKRENQLLYNNNMIRQYNEQTNNINNHKDILNSDISNSDISCSSDNNKDIKQDNRLNLKSQVKEIINKYNFDQLLSDRSEEIKDNNNKNKIMNKEEFIKTNKDYRTKAKNNHDIEQKNRSNISNIANIENIDIVGNFGNKNIVVSSHSIKDNNKAPHKDINNINNKYIDYKERNNIYVEEFNEEPSIKNFSDEYYFNNMKENRTNFKENLQILKQTQEKVKDNLVNKDSNEHENIDAISDKDNVRKYDFRNNIATPDFSKNTYNINNNKKADTYYELNLDYNINNSKLIESNSIKRFYIKNYNTKQNFNENENTSITQNDKNNSLCYKTVDILGSYSKSKNESVASHKNNEIPIAMTESSNTSIIRNDSNNNFLEEKEKSNWSREFNDSKEYNDDRKELNLVQDTSISEIFKPKMMAKIPLRSSMKLNIIKNESSLSNMLVSNNNTDTSIANINMILNNDKSMLNTKNNTDICFKEKINKDINSISKNQEVSCERVIDEIPKSSKENKADSKANSNLRNNHIITFRNSNSNILVNTSDLIQTENGNKISNRNMIDNKTEFYQVINQKAKIIQSNSKLKEKNKELLANIVNQSTYKNEKESYYRNAQVKPSSTYMINKNANNTCSNNLLYKQNNDFILNVINNIMNPQQAIKINSQKLVNTNTNSNAYKNIQIKDLAVIKSFLSNKYGEGSFNNFVYRVNKNEVDLNIVESDVLSILNNDGLNSKSRLSNKQEFNVNAHIIKEFKEVKTKQNHKTSIIRSKSKDNTKNNKNKNSRVNNNLTRDKSQDSVKTSTNNSSRKVNLVSFGKTIVNNYYNNIK